MSLSIDLYCRVVDNFGDAGVCWRLARQLAREHGADVTLLIDRPATLRAIAPRALPGARAEGVQIVEWRESPAGAARSPRPGSSGPSTRRARTAQVIVSAFGCELPAPVRARLAAAAPAPRPLWVNLEYLSAEDWVEGCHGLASVKPGDGAVEHFYYPGFTPATGGLLRERGLVEARAAFVDAGEPARWLAARGFAPDPGERLVSLFSYPDAPVRPWLEILARSGQPTRVLVPTGIAEAAVAAVFGELPPPGVVRRRGDLALQRFALLAQPDYDRLLWSCDLNFVRGEDSWIRAHWAARPFVWQPYPQADDAHRVKLAAFLRRFDQAAGPLGAAAEMMRAWSGEGALEPAWHAFAASLGVPGAPPESLAGRYARWSALLAGQRDLSSTFVEFCRNRL